MSRRTKVLITALFLALLSVPIVYAIVAWSPERPLRFRVIPDDGRYREYRYDNSMRVYDVEVVNTSAAAIHLDGGSIHVKNAVGGLMPGSLGYLDRASGTKLASGQYVALSVPAHSTVRGHACVHENFAPLFTSGRAVIKYTWVSNVRERAVRAMNAALRRLKKHPTSSDDILIMDFSSADVEVPTPTRVPEPEQQKPEQSQK
ncbi:hypothetical protein DES53_11597 [Roseimicrobium gellanilyticum]|uniref:Uncharacterized protein n=1 Tax=Roseimicrobium gellanilyticum TaxID=748857 RepID=A0A366H6R8_9BACT|nr:hypothetical protein [Roseimicrobium gellanilyticum]RBP36956.1 hypothetical protein DES53_11597 [Roseimicrobium gellanilyticum]